MDPLDKKRPHDRRRSALQYYAPTGITLSVGIALSIAMFFVVREWERNRMQVNFDRAATDCVSAVVTEIGSQLMITEALGSFVNASPDVTRSHFGAFVAPLLQQYPQIQALEWIPRVPDCEREAYEADARKDGFVDFRIADRKQQGVMVPSPRREEYFPVYFVEPLKGNALAMGFDLASDPTRLEVLSQSRDSGRMLATARITLVQEMARQYAVLVFVPLYRTGLPRDTVEQRRGTLRGFALGVYRVGDIVEHALSRLKSQGVHIHVFDESPDTDAQLLYCHKPDMQDLAPGPQGREDVAPRGTPRHVETFDVAGRNWTIVCIPADDFLSAGEPAMKISCGISEWLGVSEDTAADVMRRADAAMYRAKQSGRNRVEVLGKPSAAAVP